MSNGRILPVHDEWNYLSDEWREWKRLGYSEAEIRQVLLSAPEEGLCACGSSRVRATGETQWQCPDCGREYARLTGRLAPVGED